MKKLLLSVLLFSCIACGKDNKSNAFQSRVDTYESGLRSYKVVLISETSQPGNRFQELEIIYRDTSIFWTCPVHWSHPVGSPAIIELKDNGSWVDIKCKSKYSI